MTAMKNDSVAIREPWVQMTAIKNDSVAKREAGVQRTAMKNKEDDSLWNK